MRALQSAQHNNLLTKTLKQGEIKLKLNTF